MIFVRTPTGERVALNPAPLDIEVVDVWPAGALTDDARAAYDRLAGEGRIVPVSVYHDPANGRTVVKYLTAIPAPWIRAELKEARMAVRQMEAIP